MELLIVAQVIFDVLALVCIVNLLQAARYNTKAIGLQTDAIGDCTEGRKHIGRTLDAHTRCMEIYEEALGRHRCANDAMLSSLDAIGRTLDAHTEQIERLSQG